MKQKSAKLAPIALAASVLFVVCLLQSMPKILPESSAEGGIFNFIRRIKWMTYDARMKFASRFQKPEMVATNLSVLGLDDYAFEKMNDGTFGFRHNWPWPRYVHGRLVREFAAQGATAVGFDILFLEDYIGGPETEVETPEGRLTSDEFFAQELRAAGNVVLAMEGDEVPPDLLRTNTWAIGNIQSQRDAGIIRRAKAFTKWRAWNPAILHMSRALQLDLRYPRFFPDKIIFPRQGTDETGERFPDFEIPLKEDGSLDMEFLGADEGEEPQPPFKMETVWNFGILLAARALDLDLQNAIIRPNQVILPSKDGDTRVIPTDKDGFFYIDWALTWSDIVANRTPVHAGTVFELLIQDGGRASGATDLPAPHRGRIVVIGSVAAGTNVGDQGATPLEEKAPLFLKHLNVANSIMMNRFIHRHSHWTELGLVLLMGIVSATLTWRTRVLAASFSIISIALVYVALSVFLFVEYRYWMPLVFPVLGGLVLPHFSMVTYRVIFEQKQKGHLKAVFTKIVSPEVVQELLSAEELLLGGARRRVTVFFADVRGFTEFTDSSQATAEEYVRKEALSEAEAEAYYDAQAVETLKTVNLYLSLTADTIKKYKGTLDKYIGDCVMAFWGAPVSNPQHALSAVRAAIEAQRSIYSTNQERFAENKRREEENQLRAQRNEPPLPMLPLLSLGTGINTGVVTVGLMGSDAHILNYTVFGREVNVASRLEGVSNRGRIIISEATFKDLQRDDAELAATCVPLAPVTVKGIRQPVKIYEVPWRTPAPAPKPAGGTELSQKPKMQEGMEAPT